jgi:hypothetical protein
VRKIKYDEYQKQRAGFLRVKARLGTEKRSSSRPRDEEERRLIALLDKKRLERLEEQGVLKKLGPRRYRFTLSP